VRSLSNIDDARLAGPVTDGFTLPHALDAFRDNGAGSVEIINVFDAEIHKTTSTSISYTFTASNKIQLEKTTGATRIAGTKAEGLTGTFTVTGQIETTDYTIDRVNGILTRVVGGTIAANATVTVTYTYADPSLVTPTQVIGGVVNNVRTGIQAMSDIYSLRGYRPKLLVCPVFNENGTVASALQTMSQQLQAYFFLDAPAGTTRDEVIAGRAGTAPVGTFSTNDRRAVLCYPRVWDDSGTLQPLSSKVAGVIAGNDLRNGYWWSPSNQTIQGMDGAKGLETPLSSDFTDENTDTNALNAAGIVTVFNNFGTGFRVWGNRSALFPSDTTPLNFIPVGRTLDITLESLQRAGLPYLDRPINSALIDMIEAAGNAYLLEQVQIGALIPGSEMYWDKNNNLNTQIAAGRLTFNVRLMIPTPLETLIYEAALDISLLNNLRLEDN
jgi:phage tail sheath protein FI